MLEKVKLFKVVHEDTSPHRISPRHGNWDMETVSTPFIERMCQWEGNGQPRKAEVNFLV